MPSADAQKIASGHAWSKHRGEFPEFANEAQFAHHIDKVMANPSASKNLAKGRIAFWDDSSRTLVIKDPNSLDLGTAFRPLRGRAYFDKLK
jgi:hypothetical protein